ncbi:glycosyltransferase family 2 protein [Actinomycetota bacterium]
MAEIAIVIKTMFREKKLLRCINSIKKYMNDIPYCLYIADDGPSTKGKKDLYKKLRKNGHIVLELPFDLGFNKSRNMLLQNLRDEKYILKMDDDFEFCGETNILAMKTILDNINEIGVIADLERQIGEGKGVKSGEINKRQGFLKKEGNKLIKKNIPLNKFKYFNCNNFKYAKCDLIREMQLFKREVFKDVHWEEKLHFKGTHLDFLLQIKESKYDSAFTPDSVHLHREDLPEIMENKYRKVKNNKNDQINKKKLFEEKWGIQEIIWHESLITKIYKNSIKRLKKIKKKLKLYLKE